MVHAVIVDAVRTPSGRGKPGGALSGIHPVELLATTLRQLVDRVGLDPALVDDVIAGNVSQSGEQAVNIARNAVLSAGFPESVPGTTIDRQCGSSQQAAHFAAQGVLAGAYDVVIACGVESMSRVPMFSNAQGADPFGPGMAARYAANPLVPQGVSAELITADRSFDRQTLDEFSARSHRLAAATAAAGGFDREIVPVVVGGPDGPVRITADQTIRPGTTVQSLAGLRSAFHSDALAERFPQIGWHITAGNSSPLTDGASAMLIMSEQRAVTLGLTPRARFHAFSVVGDDPLRMLNGPIPATRKVLARAGLSIEDLDAYEINEAFAPVPLAWAQELHADPDKLNARGGAIALGHPLGASGTRVMTTLLGRLEADGGRYGLQSICEGGGMANATIIERL